MPRKRFDTLEKAKEYLEKKRKETEEKADKNGDKIVSDSSFIMRDQWSLFEKQYIAVIAIVTKSTMKDIKKGSGARRKRLR